MYIGEVEVNSTNQFLSGLLTGCQLCGLPVSWDRWWRIAEKRWERHFNGPNDLVDALRERGLSERQIIDELFDICKETIRHAGLADSGCRAAVKE